MAADIIKESNAEAGFDNAGFTIERPIDILRRRLLTGQKLPVAGDASFGTDALKPVPHWPEPGYPNKQSQSDDNLNPQAGKILHLSLIQT